MNERAAHHYTSHTGEQTLKFPQNATHKHIVRPVSSAADGNICGRAEEGEAPPGKRRPLPVYTWPLHARDHTPHVAVSAHGRTLKSFACMLTTATDNSCKTRKRLSARLPLAILRNPRPVSHGVRHKLHPNKTSDAAQHTQRDPTHDA